MPCAMLATNLRVLSQISGRVRISGRTLNFRTFRDKFQEFQDNTQACPASLKKQQTISTKIHFVLKSQQRKIKLAMCKKLVRSVLTDWFKWMEVDLIN